MEQIYRCITCFPMGWAQVHSMRLQMMLLLLQYQDEFEERLARLEKFVDNCHRPAGDRAPRLACHGGLDCKDPAFVSPI